MKEKAFISAIVYTSNNAGRASGFLLSLDEFMDSAFENYEIIVVNDASTDGILDRIAGMAEKLRRDLKVISLAWKHGPEAGILAGVDLAIGDFVVELEVDKFDCSMGILLELFTEANRGFDVVAAVRKTGHGIGDRILFKLFNDLSYLPFEIFNESVRIVSRRAINSLMAMHERVIHRGILYRYSGFPGTIVEYEPVRPLPENRGMVVGEKLRFVFDIIVSYSNIGMNVSVVFATFFMLVSTILGLYALSVFFIYRGAVQGWTTTMLFMSVCFSGIFLVMGLQGRYLSAIVFDIKKRPVYVVKSIDRVSIKGPRPTASSGNAPLAISSESKKRL